jgi:SAM-dependent methyltransferase
MLRKVLPKPFVIWYDKFKLLKFKKMNAQQVFTEIYNKNHWGSSESISGKGSEYSQTAILIKALDQIFSEYNVKSVLDIPCGDFNWMQKVNFNSIEYIGADIVEKLIERNKVNYKTRSNCEFKVINIINDPLPKSDLIFVRDCLVHLSYNDIELAINNIKRSGSKYLLTTTFTARTQNKNIITGDWRPINLEKTPFNFPPPVLLINENCSEDGGRYNDKSIALWDIGSL